MVSTIKWNIIIYVIKNGKGQIRPRVKHRVHTKLERTMPPCTKIKQT